MATIQKRIGKNGTRHTATIRIKRGGSIVHQESATFGSMAAARAWGRKRETELEQPGALDAKPAMRTVADAVNDYITDREAVAPLGRTKRYALNLLARAEIGAEPLDMPAARIIQHAIDRRKDGAGAATVAQDIIYLRVLINYARSAWGLSLDLQVVADAAETLRRERFIGKSRRRKRRPSHDELRRIHDHFRDLERRKGGIPGALYRITWALIYSTRRLEELMSLRMDDYDQARGRWLVRAVKNPKGSAGNHRPMVVTPQFARVVAASRELSDGDRLFPFVAKSVGTAWQRQMKLLGIQDLHLHDLRHEGCSRLAEDGWTIPQIQSVSLHDAWASLQIYVNLGDPDPHRIEFDD